MRVIPLLLVLSFTCIGQESKYACNEADKTLTKTYFDERDENDRKARMVRQIQKGQIPFCWHGCAMKLTKPVLPKATKDSRIMGSVNIFAIADESGRIFWAKAISGPEVLKPYAREAACRSTFSPILYKDSPIKFTWSIRYDFAN